MNPEIDYKQWYEDTLQENLSLKEMNELLRKECYDLKYPERAILCVSHDGNKEESGAEILMLMYNEAANNRLCISDVKDQDGNVKTALCGIVPNEDEEKGSLELFPLFIIEDILTTRDKFSFPAPNGEWIGQGENTESAFNVRIDNNV